VFQCDQSDRRQLEAVAAAIDRPVFAVVDDGSHVPQHQVATFDYLFSRLLAPGGTYIIEDIETSYWTRNGLYGYPTRYGYHHEQSCVEVFKDLLDDVNAEFLSPEARRAQERRVGRDLSPATRAAVTHPCFAANAESTSPSFACRGARAVSLACHSTNMVLARQPALPGESIVATTMGSALRQPSATEERKVSARPTAYHAKSGASGRLDARAAVSVAR
jgi:hypothetical protein